jgi:hypothetical protein
MTTAHVDFGYELNQVCQVTCLCLFYLLSLSVILLLYQPLLTYSWHNKFLIIIYKLSYYVCYDVSQWNWPPRYNWNIVESGIKHHKTIKYTVMCYNDDLILFLSFFSVVYLDSLKGDYPGPIPAKRWQQLMWTLAMS